MHTCKFMPMHANLAIFSQICGKLCKYAHSYRFMQICTFMQIYMQICTCIWMYAKLQSKQIWANLGNKCTLMQIWANSCRCMNHMCIFRQICGNVCKYAHSCKFVDECDEPLSLRLTENVRKSIQLWLIRI